MKKLPFVWEIGCEEIPARWLSPLIADLETRMRKALEDVGLEAPEIDCYGTLRRLVVHLPKLPERQPDREERVVGPPLRIARDETGEWTKAALGFAKKNRIAPDELGVIETDKGDYVGFELSEKGKKSLQLLPSVMAATLRGLSFPKFMNWDASLDDGKGPLPFGRPIRWMVSLYGNKVVPFEIRIEGGGHRETVASGRKSRGHRFLAAKGRKPGASFNVSSFRELKSGLKKNYVLLDPAERRERLLKELTKLEKKARAPRAPGLAPELTAELVEWPGAVLGRYPEELMALPEEVRHTVLIHHQHYFPLQGKPAFIAVTNMASDPKGQIRKGSERVVLARLRDAEFFWKEDMKKPLAEHAERLEGVVFHEKLGSYRRKVERVVPLALRIADRCGAREASVRRSAELAKCDLVTGMVGEFPELQGIMGGLYAREQGESEPVWKAVYSHYFPIGLSDEAFPLSREGAVLALADKMDSLVAMFAVGIVPTGSRDPYAQRRTALGAIRLLLESGDRLGFPLDLTPESLIGDALDVVGAQPNAIEANAPDQLSEFFRERIRYVLGRTYPYDELNAVFAVDPLAVTLGDLVARLKAIHGLRGSEDFDALSAAFKRVGNILSDFEPPSVDRTRLVEAAETELSAALEKLEPEAARLIEARDYRQALTRLSSLRAPVDRFFDEVLVMAEDRELRVNRLALLARLRRLLAGIADLSQIASGDSE